MKRYFSTLMVALLAIPIIAALPAHAATTVPQTVQITDPSGDANTQNMEGGNVSDVADLQKIWFTNDATTISVHVLTTAPLPSARGSIGYDVFANPNDDFPAPRGCLLFRTIEPQDAPGGGVYQGPEIVRLLDRCNDKDLKGEDGKATIEALEDGTGLLTMTFDRDYSPFLADGLTITQSEGESITWAGKDGVSVPGVTSGVRGLVLDKTDLGTDYALASGGSETPPTGPPANKPPKPCKAKGVAHGCKGNKPKPPAAAGCPAYTPGDAGKDAKTTVVTDAATADAPVKLDAEIDPGVGTGTDTGLGLPTDPLGASQMSHVYLNLQVDSATASAGLYVRAEFDSNSDDDLYLYNADGSEAAHAAGFNPNPNATLGLDGTGSGGHSEVGAEQLDGVTTADCQGYTVDLAGATTQGGTVTFKFWLGEATYDPAAASSGASKPI